MCYTLSFIFLILSVKTSTGYRVRWITFNRRYKQQGEHSAVYVREFPTLWPALRWGTGCAWMFTELDGLAVAPGQQGRGLPVQDVGGIAVADEAGGLSVTEDNGGLSVLD